VALALEGIKVVDVSQVAAVPIGHLLQIESGQKALPTQPLNIAPGRQIRTYLFYPAHSL